MNPAIIGHGGGITKLSDYVATNYPADIALFRGIQYLESEIDRLFALAVEFSKETTPGTRDET
jgi:hypothetical protein